MGLFLGKIFTQSNGKKNIEEYCILGTVLGALVSALNSCLYEAFIVGGRQMIDKISQSSSWREIKGDSVCVEAISILNKVTTEVMSVLSLLALIEWGCVIQLTCHGSLIPVLRTGWMLYREYLAQGLACGKGSMGLTS